MIMEEKKLIKIVHQEQQQQCYIIGEKDDESEEEEEEENKDMMKAFLHHHHHHHHYHHSRVVGSKNNSKSKSNNNYNLNKIFMIRISCYVIAFLFVVITINNINLVGKFNIKQTPSSLPLSSSSVPNTNTNTNTKNQNHDYHDYDWNDVREALCPNYHPNLNLGNVLFDMARKEITTDETEDDQDGNEITTATETMIKDYQNEANRFYSGNFVEPLICKTPNNKTTVIYVPIWKAANNAIHGFIQKSSPYHYHNNRNNNHDDDLDDHNSKHSRHNKKSSKKPYLDCHYSDNIMAPYDEIVINKDNEQQDQDHDDNDDNDDLCLITAIRDPISHFLSGYNEIEYRWDVDYNRYFHNQDKTINASYTSLVMGSEERFIQFVKDLLLRPQTMKSGTYHHIESMSRILPILNSYDDLTSKLQYLPSITNLSEKFPKFLQNSCGKNIPNGMVSNQTKPVYLKGGKSSHKSSNDPLGTYQAAKSVFYNNHKSNNDGSTARALCIIHSMDYACWRDLSQTTQDDDDGIPELCKEIYSNKEKFIIPLLNNGMV